MPRASGFSRHRPTGRAIIISVAMVAFFVLVFGRAIARFYVDGLWFLALGRGDVFWGQIGARVGLFVTFFIVFVVLAMANLYVADRFAPSEFPANVHPVVERFHEVFGQRLRVVRYSVAVLFALVLALPASSQWQSWMLFRHSASFGKTDPQFGRDVGFYVFRLPFIAFTIDWLFAALIVVLLVTLAAHLLNGDVVFMSSTPVVRSAMKVHLAVLLAVLAIVKAADYWISRYELTNETRGFVQGATYTVVNAELPALALLTLIALLTAGLYLYAVRTGRWRLPIVTSVLWLVVLLLGAIVYPALVQSLVVQPNQAEREAPYIERNIVATRSAMGIDNVIKREVEFGRLDTAEVESDLTPFRDVRLLNPEVMLSRFSLDRGKTAGLKIADLDVNRAEIDGRQRQILVTARELDIEHVPNTSWQGIHLVSTHGCGLVMAPASSVTSDDQPIYSSPELDRDELYFSPAISGYAITRTDVEETSCGGESSAERYAGTAGVALSGFIRKMAVATAFLDYNFVFSDAIKSDSQLLWVRSVTERVEKLAPFLEYDGDPYPVVVDGGVQWVVDAYTSTTAYPYAQRIGNVQLSGSTGLSPSANYVRNSVKAVVDAYSGAVTFYVVDESDPILRAWQGAFPKLFTPAERMPDELRDNLRYPEDLFRVQTERYSKYQLSPDVFFQYKGAWSVAQAPSVQARTTSAPSGAAAGASSDSGGAADLATESNVRRFVPYYTMFEGPDGTQQFVIVRPFVPFSSNDDRTELQAYMTASSDPDTYGELVSYTVTNNPLPEGPKVVATKMESEQAISSELTQQDNTESGTSVVFGDLQILPVADGLIYVRPFYVESNNVAEFRYVIVSHNSNAALGCDLGSALRQLFPGFDVTIGDRLDDQGRPLPPASCGSATGGLPTSDPGENPSTTSPSGVDDDSTAAELIAQAEDLFGQADELLRQGDLGGYQALVEQGAALVVRANELLNP